jgi:quercetin dioxygenase-like cupin family protein
MAAAIFCGSLAFCVSAQESAKVSTEGVTYSILFEAPIVGGHLPDLDGKYKLRVSEMIFEDGAFVGTHHHVGPGVRQILEGEIEVSLPSKTVRYGARELFMGIGDVDHEAHAISQSKLTVFEILPVELDGPSWITPPDQ